ncbi:dihydroneopterin triphosphate 2'-epimerase [Paraglaciecola sp.]|uniref:dihydroneopterin triphosphate 2'-epimerase n=1 Tax=Paraglaciecola sp. TaxID=1920173 RepID=UPI0032636421
MKSSRLRTYIDTNDYEMANALNCEVIIKHVSNLVENNLFSFLKKLTAQVLTIAAERAWVNYAEVDKTHASRFCDSLFLCLSCNKH